MKLNEYQTIYYGGIKATIKNFPGINGDIVVFYENLMMAPNNVKFFIYFKVYRRGSFRIYGYSSCRFLVSFNNMLIYWSNWKKSI